MVSATDGISLAVHEYGDPGSPALVLVHGYPDDHHVWDGVIALLADRFHLIAVDVRGSGGSGAPAHRSGYRIPQLVADLGAVVDATLPGQPFDLLAHDWGSILCWDALSDPGLGPRITSFTSVSGPSLDMAGRWLRERGHLRASAAQLAASYYVAAFQAPLLPELLIRKGLLARLITMSQRGGRHARPTGRTMDPRTAAHGLELYRANFTGRMVRPRPGPITTPVQVLAPTDDAHVTPALAIGAPAPYVVDLRSELIPGNHWVVEQYPELIVDRLERFLTSLAEGD